jgi:hypothetical protein
MSDFHFLAAFKCARQDVGSSLHFFSHGRHSLSSSSFPFGTLRMLETRRESKTEDHLFQRTVSFQDVQLILLDKVGENSRIHRKIQYRIKYKKVL